MRQDFRVVYLYLVLVQAERVMIALSSFCHQLNRDLQNSFTLPFDISHQII